MHGISRRDDKHRRQHDNRRNQRESDERHGLSAPS
jgi:hypothetical protein